MNGTHLKQLPTKFSILLNIDFLFFKEAVSKENFTQQRIQNTQRFGFLCELLPRCELCVKQKDF